MSRSLYSEIFANRLKTFFIFFIFILLITGFFGVLGYYYENSPWELAFIGVVFSFLSVISSYFFSDKLVLASLKARPANKNEFFDFYTVTENLCLASGLPMPKLYVLDEQAPNAFATGRNPKNAVVCATTGLLNTLNRSEIEGVVAHELSHIKNYDTLLMSVVAMLVGSINIITNTLIRSRLLYNRHTRRSRGFALILIIYLLSIVLTPIIALLIQMAISRQREYLADASASLLTRYPEGLADALEKISKQHIGLKTASASTAHLFIVNPFASKNWQGKISGFFSTHPPIEKRIQILRNI